MHRLVTLSSPLCAPSDGVLFDGHDCDPRRRRRSAEQPSVADGHGALHLRVRKLGRAVTPTLYGGVLGGAAWSRFLPLCFALVLQRRGDDGGRL